MVQSQLDSLPYIDAQISDEELESIRSLVAAEVRSSGQAPHPGVPQEPKSFLTARLKEQMESIANGDTSEKGIDLTKYSDLTSGDKFDMQRVYVALAYSRLRQENLDILEKHGKNQWLVANDEVDQDLQLVEREVERERARLNATTKRRTDAQLAAKPTLEYLETKWRDSLKGLVDVNVAIALEEQRQNGNAV